MNMAMVPRNYRPIKGSERRKSPTASFLRPADKNENVTVTIVLRRRPDGPPLPDVDSFSATGPSRRRRMPEAEFAAKYGAAASDIDKVTAFLNASGLTVGETHAARRTIVASGTVEQINRAFVVTLGRYE